MRRLAAFLVASTLCHTARADYAARCAEVDAARRTLAAELVDARGAAARAELLARARQRLFHALADEIIPAWLGTRWTFSGTSQTPGTGSIACGYFVTTVLRDAGLLVERAHLAQQPSELIVRTLCAPPRIRRFSDRPVADVLAEVRAQGQGIYVVGLDFHVGLLVNDGAAVRFCHSSYLGPVAVTCEPAATAPALPSRYTVLGPLLTQAVVTAWLEGRPLPAVGGGRRVR